eukprot:149781-Rhodomonas_salina.1
MAFEWHWHWKVEAGCPCWCYRLVTGDVVEEKIQAISGGFGRPPDFAGTRRDPAWRDPCCSQGSDRRCS